MMALPSQINISNYTIHTFGIFVLLGFLIFSFVIWTEGKKDGFNEEKLFDLLLITVVSSILVSRVIGFWGTTTSAGEYFSKIYRVWEPGYSYTGALLGFLMPLWVLTKLWRWSFYRIVDIFSLGVSLAFSVTLLGYVGLQGRFEYLFAFAAWVFLYAFLSAFRNSRIKSGYAFSIFLAVNAFLGLIFFNRSENLIFYILLVTLSTVVFLFRWRLAKDDQQLFSNFIGRIKSSIRRERN